MTKYEDLNNVKIGNIKGMKSLSYFFGVKHFLSHSAKIYAWSRTFLCIDHIIVVAAVVVVHACGS